MKKAKVSNQEKHLSSVYSLISCWCSHNSWAVGTVKKMGEVELHYLPERSATAWWQYTRLQHALEDSIKEDIFVPSLMILMNPANESGLNVPQR